MICIVFVVKFAFVVISLLSATPNNVVPSNIPYLLVFRSPLTSFQTTYTKSNSKLNEGLGAAATAIDIVVVALLVDGLPSVGNDGSA